MDRRPSVAKPLPGSAIVAAPVRTLLLWVILLSVSWTSDLSAQCSQTPSAGNCSFGYVEPGHPNVLVSTRNGMLFGGYRVVVRDASPMPIAGREVWIFRESESQSTQYLEQDAGFETVCIGQEYEECPGEPSTYSYVEGHTGQNGAVTFPLKFGGHGTGADFRISIPSIQCLGCSEMPPTGITLATLPYKSTDMNADGAWNSADRAIFQPCLGSSSDPCKGKADFDLNNVVDYADLAILEADIAAGCGENRRTCAESHDTFAPAAVSDLSAAYFEYTDALMQWTDVGDNGTTGQAAWYEIRRSSVQITDQNWCDAAVVGSGVPQASGTYRSGLASGLPDCTQHYLALKTADAVGNWSTVSNVVSGSTCCIGQACGIEITWQDPNAAEYPQTIELVSANPQRGTGVLSYGVPASLSGQPLELSVYDLVGRRARTLVQGAAAPGRFTVQWNRRSDNGTPLGPGVYFVRLRLGSETLKSKVTLIQ